ncbi:hypothetical protein H0H87_000339, partial [Tephrocybe sp. NHM501043]
MSHITNIGNVETATAIWEFDPALKDNHVFGSSLDVVSAICTLTIKTQSSAQRIEFFEQCQTQRGIPDPVKIPLHSNIRWGTAHAMLNCTYELRQPLGLFLNGTDELFGPITTLRKKGRIVKHIKWATFKLIDEDWACVGNTRDILADANNIQQVFSSDKHPTLWHALPALEQLLSVWEKKKDDPHYTLYIKALE